MKKLNIALLSGGISTERDVSLNGGDQVYQALDKSKYHVVKYDPKFDLGRLVTDAPNIDFSLIILHGPYGEDGTIQGLLDLLNIPYQGSGVLGSAVAMSKLVSKQIYAQAGIPSPPYLVFKKGETIDSRACVQELGLPVVIKPVQGGSSIGMSIVKDEDHMQAAFKAALECDDTILVEKFIKGTELTGGVIGNQDLTALPIVEIKPSEKFDFFDYTAKYTPGATSEICPAPIDDDIALQAQTYARMAHNALCCQDYSRTDMILADGEIYVLETNTIPGMTPTSLLPLAAKTAGISFDQLLDKLIELGLERHSKKS